ncbi:follicle cell protein 3C-1 isoform X3 [Sitophilus oryzae]|uniref:Follicle cell protein 3C-1 isoform X3 n=1 Tax=Sitophilus oryzae TaxID=7048 RepID=A0A6J2XWP1_SITOR|nr:follicle cell protein 3C-1 isoform X3 [Sitophilus oryzae]
MKRFTFFYCLVLIAVFARSSAIITNDIEENQEDQSKSQEAEIARPEDTPCTCGVFLSSQFKRGSKDQPKGDPVLTQEIDAPFMNNAFGNKQCTHRCLEMIVKHLPKSSDIICGTVDKEKVYREKASLFVRNHSEKWHPTSFSAGREFCCKDYAPVKCSEMS